MGVDFCTQCEYPPLQYEGDALLRNADLKPFRRHSAAPFGSTYQVGLPPFGRKIRHIISSFQG